MSRIINHNDLPFKTSIIRDEYWDLHLFNELNCACFGCAPSNCVMVDIDAGDDRCFLKNGEIASLAEYSDAVNKGLSLENIGRTGIDNGMVVFDRDAVTDEEFAEIYTSTTYEIEDGDKRLRLHGVSGNGKVIDYGKSLEFDSDEGRVFNLQGGWYQGFFKVSNGCEYNVLPNDIMDDATFEFRIKMERPESSRYMRELPTINEIHPENAGTFFYIGTRSENKWSRYYDDEFSKAEEDVSDLRLDVGEFSQPNIVEIQTDNKFTFFDRTDDGFTVETWDSDIDIVLTDVRETFSDNPFIMFNRTKDGVTAKTFAEGNGYTTKNYSVVDDLCENAFSLYVDEMGRIGYRYLIRDCESENGYSIATAASNPGNIRYGEWETVTMKVKSNEKYMKISIYVGGKLVLLSRELPKMRLRTLNDTDKKQEGVAFNISLGGGTQGLIDATFSDYKDTYKNDLPVEKHFGGSFIGKIKYFKILARC